MDSTDSSRLDAASVSRDTLLRLDAAALNADGPIHADAYQDASAASPETGPTEEALAIDADMDDAASGNAPILDGAEVDQTRRPKPRAILVSVDGLGAYYLQQQMAQGRLPSFAALKHAGASTLNARADYAYTVTLPNHTSMITGLPVSADPDLPDTAYHGWTINAQVPATTTLHNDGNPNLSYVSSVFDVVHDHGGSTCLYSGKTKFSLFANSYNALNGAPDRFPPNDGRNKIDRVVIVDSDTEALMDSVEADLSGHVCDFAFVHIADTDRVGHSSGWGSEAWFSTLQQVDGWVGRLAAFADQQTAAPFYLIVTADHGGSGSDHSDATLPIDYTIPFFLMGPGIPMDTDLYALTSPNRCDPGVARPRYSASLQPVRNSDAANLVTDLMGLPPVPGSFMQDLLR